MTLHNTIRLILNLKELMPSLKADMIHVEEKFGRIALTLQSEKKSIIIRVNANVMDIYIPAQRWTGIDIDDKDMLSRVVRWLKDE